MTLVETLYRRGLTVHQIARRLKYPMRIVKAILAHTIDPSVQRWLDQHPTPQAQSLSTARCSTAAPSSVRMTHRISRVSFEHVAPFIDELLPR